MNRFDLLFGLVSLLPAALNPNPGRAHATLLARLCSGDGVVRTVQLPVGNGGVPGGLPGSDGQSCCAKGCHAGAARRRPLRKLDLSQ